ncbi:MAG: glycosyl transferase [Lamprobacter sp.]|uniref:glycosyl transferase n=1 Tax=Lamprobacter sp. TaxID=3100796 RepID=UPI002B262522|nr:glycosyl transferase [Lamprobacter sp.]MEA3638360.1 glycosyl transferase [Lamprobacter sp.]
MDAPSPALGQFAGLFALAALSLSAFAVSALLTALLAQGRLAIFQVLDHPNERSLHAHPVPRTGGIALLAGLGAGLLAGWAVGLATGLWSSRLSPVTSAEARASAALLPWLGSALLLVAGVSFWDDRVDLSRRLRLLVHLMAALLLWWGGLRWDHLGLPGPLIPLPLLLALPLTLLYSIWMLNLYNFMDGMDGLAGGMASIGFGTLALLGYTAGDLPYSLCCAAVAAAAAGFLTRNLPPARIFLGDIGASSLGLLAAGLSLWGASVGLFPLWISGLIFSPFIVDATWTLLRRARRGERLWDAHRSHHYQRLVLAGWGHRRTLYWALALMAAAAASALAAPRLTTSEHWQLIAGWALIFVLIHLRVGLAERIARG